MGLGPASDGATSGGGSDQKGASGLARMGLFGLQTPPWPTILLLSGPKAPPPPPVPAAEEGAKWVFYEGPKSEGTQSQGEVKA